MLLRWITIIAAWGIFGVGTFVLVVGAVPVIDHWMFEGNFQSKLGQSLIAVTGFLGIIVTIAYATSVSLFLALAVSKKKA